ncbi:hypothetical protein FHW64_006415 [Variovorax sp. Sphag1AA]|nr:hypothetical protein [Variovorax sp. Sphag1AA]
MCRSLFIQEGFRRNYLFDKSNEPPKAQINRWGD